jgi:iron-sulfur cluster assembly protein
MPTEQAILDALRAIIDPDFQQDIVSLGFVQDLEIQDGNVSFKIELTTPACSIKEQFRSQAERRVRRVPGVIGVRVTMTARGESPGAGPGSACAHAGGEAKIPSVTVTEKALDALRQYEWADGDFLRIGIVPGGCSGHTYSAAMDDELFINDLILHESGGLRIVTDPDSAQWMDGLEIDYSDDLVRSGFRFRNPNSGGSCGCGSSFKA